MHEDFGPEPVHDSMIEEDEDSSRNEQDHLARVVREIAHQTEAQYQEELDRAMRDSTQQEEVARARRESQEQETMASVLRESAHQSEAQYEEEFAYAVRESTSQMNLALRESEEAQVEEALKSSLRSLSHD